MFPEFAKRIPIVGILKTNSKYKYGIAKNGNCIYMFSPLNQDIPPMIVSSKINDSINNYLCLANYIEWNQKFPKGGMIEVLGKCGDWEAEKKAILYQYCPYTHKRNINIEDAIEIKTDKVKNITEWKTINIDPENCIDIDDCISYKIKNDVLKIAITIANVANIVKRDTEIDDKALLIGQTFYSENYKTSMLHPIYEKECSLNLGQKRNGVSLFINWSISQNKIVKTPIFKETLIVNQETYTYENIYSSKHKELMEFMKSFNVFQELKNDSHKWIETLMLFYNIEAAKLLRINHMGIFRKHEAPRNHNIYEKYCEFLSYKSAKYCLYDDDLFHYGLNTKLFNIPEYCHITSPIRRYADLVNQRLLLQILNNQIDRENFNQNIIDVLNERNKFAKKHDRELFFIQLIENSSNNIVEGIVIDMDIDKTKIYVYCDMWKRIIAVNVIDLKVHYIEQKVSLKYFYNPCEASWKKRLIFQIY